MNDLEKAFAELSAKTPVYAKLFQYAEGVQPLIYSTTKLREAFNGINARFSQNWISVVIDSALDRLGFSGWSTGDKLVDDALGVTFSKYRLQLEAFDVHRSALITHEAFVIAWLNTGGELDIYYNDPWMCHLFYDPEAPKRKTFGAKWYQGSDEKYHLTLYYPDRLEYYITRDKVKGGLPSSAKMFIADEIPSAINPFGIIPMFHFRVSKGISGSEIAGVITLQDAVNKLLADMMVAAEFGAFRQRYIITNADTLSLKNAPNEIWSIPAEAGVQTQVGEFGESNLDLFLSAIDKLANSIAIISRTPKHYFMSAGAQVSGEALIAMESPLVAKVEKHQRNLEVTWIELGAFLMQLQGIVVDVSQLKAVWQPAQSVQPMTEAQTIKTNTEAGVPLSVALRWAGKTDKEIAEVEAIVQKEKKEQKALGQLMIEKARIEQESSAGLESAPVGDDQDVPAVLE